MQLEEIEKTEIDQLLNIISAKQTILCHLYTNMITAKSRQMGWISNLCNL